MHVVAENLLIEGRPGGPLLSADSGLLEARPDAGLKIDPGMVVILGWLAIEATVGTSSGGGIARTGDCPDFPAG